MFVLRGRGEEGEEEEKNPCLRKGRRIQMILEVIVLKRPLFTICKIKHLESSLQLPVDLKQIKQNFWAKTMPPLSTE